MTVIRAGQEIHDAYIGYENLASEAITLAGTAPAAGFAFANLFNWFTYDGYKSGSSGVSNVDVTLSGAKTCDYFAYYNTDLHDNGGNIRLQFWNGAIWVDSFAAHSPTDNAPFFIKFAQVSSDKYRIVIDSTPASIVSVVSFGNVTPIPYGLSSNFNSPHNAQQYKNITNESETGNFIGRSVRKGATPFNVSSELFEYDWMISTWRPFLRHLERKPCFFKWSDTTYTEESVFCWSEPDIATPSYSDGHFLNIDLSLRGLVL